MGIICSICDDLNPKILNTKVGLVILCNRCVLLGVESAKEIATSKVKPSIDTPGSLYNKPATCTLLLHTYFKIYYNATKH
jgi:hypothetical protein